MGRSIDGAQIKKAVQEKTQLNFTFQRIAKRFLDICLSAAGFIFLAPLFLILMLAVKLDSKGPVIYKHKRIGRNAEPFFLLKFRTMVAGGDDSQYLDYLKNLIESERAEHHSPAESLSSESGKNGKNAQFIPDQVVHQNGLRIPNNHNGLAYKKMDSDPRITRVGEFLRKYYLDELPQLWNILIGEMSIVGPRPHVQLEVDYYTDEQCRRLSVPPGATGLWQVAGKADCTFNELIALDLEYIDNWSLALDLEIITRTVMVMVQGGEQFWARMDKKLPEKTIKKSSWKTPRMIHKVLQEKDFADQKEEVDRSKDQVQIP